MRNLLSMLACAFTLCAILSSCDDEPTEPRDSTFPATVHDLVAGSPTDSTVTLSWTAPGDDGETGQAAQYDLRWAVAQITEATWAAATPVSPQPVPQAAGSRQEYVATGLQKLTTYYFAIRTADEASNWSGLSDVTQATTPYVARDPADLVQKLAASYSRLDRALFDVLFPTTVQYFYFLNEPLPNGDTHWGLTEELRIHQRMFAPEETPPGEAPVPAELWLSSISITLTPLAQFIERPDLYTPNGELDPTRWKAMQADYAASILFDTVSNSDYRVEGIANFVVIEDLTLPTGSDSKFSIYRWEDLGTRLEAVEEKSWSNIKAMYGS